MSARPPSAHQRDRAFSFPKVAFKMPVWHEHALCRDRARANREFGLWGAEDEEQRAAAGFRPNGHLGERATGASGFMP